MKFLRLNVLAFFGLFALLFSGGVSHLMVLKSVKDIYELQKLP